VFNGAATLAELVRRCRSTLAESASEHEIVLVNDASGDGSWPVIAELAESSDDVRGIDLARNFGQHNALLAGIREARCGVTVTIDDDLQNPPEEIPRLLEALSADCDVAYGAPIVSSFRAFRTELREGFVDYTGPDVSIDGLLTWRTERFCSVPVRHDPRAHGRSNYSLLKLVRHTLTMITAFSTRPLRIASGLGFLMILFGIGVLVYVLTRFMIEGGSVPGFPFLASIISIFAGAQLFSIGVIGEYLARVHVRVMTKPSYAIRARVGDGPAIRSGPDRGAGNGHLCRELEWDSHFWGFPVGRVTTAELGPEEARQVAAWCDRAGIRCAYLLAAANDRATAVAAESVGFRPVDTRVTLVRPPGLPSGGREGREAGAQIRPANPSDAEEVAALARRAHTDTRFFFDPNFAPRRAAEMYAAWVRRGFEDGGRHLLLADGGEAVAGYALLTDDPPSIDLIAVSERARGGGVGRALLEAAITEHSEAPLRVATQARNVSALRLYQSGGFQVTATETWFHRWK
jgi:undecaprenyl-phosphate 4-deoxy-4-formamido-L-arabinose transferase